MKWEYPKITSKSASPIQISGISITNYYWLLKNLTKQYQRVIYLYRGLYQLSFSRLDGWEGSSPNISKYTIAYYFLFFFNLHKSVITCDPTNSL